MVNIHSWILKSAILQTTLKEKWFAQESITKKIGFSDNKDTLVAGEFLMKCEKKKKLFLN